MATPLPEIHELLRSRKESRTLEFKASMSLDARATQVKVIRAALAMANLRDGGYLVFGGDEIVGEPLVNLVGMSPEDYASFTQDTVSQLVNSHATPHIDLSVEHVTLDDKQFVVIVVRPFVDLPVIAARDFIEGTERVRIGRLYCRSRRTPETTLVESIDDLREILDLAVDKGVERYFRHREIERRATGPTAAERFAREARALL
jgi:predicted HTH transcriptional regulator